MREFLKRSCAAILFAGGGALPATAVIIEAGTIETSGDTGTVDLVYFNLDSAGITDISYSAFCGMCGVLTDEAVGANVYAVNPDGTPGALIASEPGSAGDPSVSFEDLMLGIGTFVIAVGSFELDPGELPPLQMDANITRAFDYEIGFSGSAGTNAVIACTIDGNLDGSVDVDVRIQGTACALPTAIPEPGMLALLGLGLVAAWPLTRQRQG